MSVFTCRRCEYSAPSLWVGFCPQCRGPYRAKKVGQDSVEQKNRSTFAAAATTTTVYIPTGVEGIDYVLGGGLVAGNVVLFGGFRGSGKCLGRGTPVLKYNGMIVPVEEVCEGDVLMGLDSMPRRVLSTTRGIGPLYKIVPNKGEPWVCNNAHVLTLFDSYEDKVFDIPLEDYVRYTGWRKTSSFWTLFQPDRVHFTVPYTDEDQPVSPYFVGIWLGDGTKEVRDDGQVKGIAVTKPDAEIEMACRDEAARFGLRITTIERDGKNMTYRLVNEKGATNPLLEAMRRLMPLGPRVPPAYLLGSEKVRSEVLAGLLDTDGHHNKGGYEFVQKNKQIANDTAFLARSLGLRVARSIKTVNGVDYQRLFLSGETAWLPLRIPRKKAQPRKQIKNALRTGFRVEALGDGEYFGFMLDGDGRFLLGDFTVTHNSTLWVQALDSLSARRKVMYASSEQSAEGVGQIARRVGACNDKVTVLGNQSNIESTLAIVKEERVFCTIYDSLQKFVSSRSSGAPGSAQQGTAVASAIKEDCRTRNTCAVVINQMARSGELRGGTDVEHDLDTIAVLAYPQDKDEDAPGDEKDGIRMLIVDKNRSGEENRRSYFRMDESGKMEHVEKKSKIIDIGRGKYRRD